MNQNNVKSKPPNSPSVRQIEDVGTSESSRFRILQDITIHPAGPVFPYHPVKRKSANAKGTMSESGKSERLPEPEEQT